MDSARLIALDWGTSSLRAWLLDEQGAVLDARDGGLGIMQLPGHDFAAVYNDSLRTWLTADPSLPAIASGMIGSRNGWREAPYVNCPAEPGTLAERLTTVTDGITPLHIVPGVMQAGGSGRLPDVMRGEETQVLGALAGEPALGRDSILVLPGTHSKWVSVRHGRIDAFTTYMTGELFAVLTQHSILGRPGRQRSAQTSDAAFSLGVTTARDMGGAGISAALFSTRSRLLTGSLEEAGTAAYLSGLLIGEELRSALSGRTGSSPLRLIGSPALCARYAQALEHFDVADSATIDDAAVHGLWQIASAAGLIRR